ncbi:MAG TPA: MMPL family transporter, partial [Streptosporangiaceae bacterium]
LVLAHLNPALGPAAARQQAGAVAAKLTGCANVAAVTPPRLDQARTAALIDVVPASAPSAAATATLVTSIRGQAAALSHATGTTVAVTGTTAIDVDVSARLSAALLPFASIVVGLSLLLLMLVFRSLIVPVKAAIGFLLSVGASFGATVAVFQWGWLAGPVASYLPIVLMAVLFGLAMDYEVFLVSRIREDYTRSHDPRHAIIAGGGAAARVVVAAAVIMTCIFASFLLSGDTTIKSLAVALAIGVACDALLVRMTIVPAVLALTGKHAWHIPRWLNRILPDLDIEGTSLQHQPTPPAAGEKAGTGQHQADKTAPRQPTPHH